MANQIKKKFLENDSVDGSKLKLLEGQSVRIVVSGQEVDLIKPEAGKVKVLGEEVELKSSSDSKLAEAKSYADSQDASKLAEGKSYADSQDASKLAEAKSYADSAVLVEKNRAESAEAQALVDAKAYADEKKSEALAIAEAAILSEKSRAESAEGVLTSSINTEKGRIDAILSASQADKDSFAEVVNLINSVDTENDSAFASYVISNNAALASETSARQSADSALDVRVTGLENNKASKTYVDNTFETKAAHLADKNAMQTTFSTEKALRESEEARIEGKIDSEILRAQAAEESKLVEAKAYTDSQIALIPDVDLTNYYTKSEVDSQEAAKLVEAKAYTDSQIALIPAVDLTNYYNKSEVDSKDSAKLAEAKAYSDSVAQAMQSSVESAIGAVVADVQDLEGYAQDIRSDADSLDARVTVLENSPSAPTFKKKKLVIGEDVGATVTSVLLPHLAVDNSITAFVGRMGIHQDEDFTVSVENGVTKLTFIGSLLNPSGDEAVVNGDKVFVTYAI